MKQVVFVPYRGAREAEEKEKTARGSSFEMKALKRALSGFLFGLDSAAAARRTRNIYSIRGNILL